MSTSESKKIRGLPPTIAYVFVQSDEYAKSKLEGLFTTHEAL